MAEAAHPQREPARPDDIRVVPLRHPGRWIAAAVVLLVAAQFVHFLVSNPAINRPVIRDFLFNRAIVAGVVTTLELTAIAMVVGIGLGIGLAVMRLSANPVVSGAAWLYIWFFRGTPVLVQLLFWFFIPKFLPTLSIGIPFGPSFGNWNPVNIITPFVAAILGLGLNEAAYMAEIARAGLLSVDEGQVEAAGALGMTRSLTMRRIVLPQAMRVIIPPTGNETISMLKTTSLVIVVSVNELLGTAQIIYARNFQTVALLLVASLWYIAITSVLYVGQYYLERHYARGSSRALPPTPWQRVTGRLRRRPVPPAAPLTVVPGASGEAR